MRPAWLIVPLLAVAVAAGCIASRKAHTFYLSPEGSLTWTVLQREIRSDAGDTDSRDQEERDFLASVTSGTHPVAEALKVLEPERLTTRVWRAERPFTVETTARFGAVDRLARQILDHLGLPARVYLDREGARVELEILIRRRDLERVQAESDDCDGLDLLPLLDADSMSDYRIVLTEGRFIAASGFAIANDATVASPADVDLDQLEDENGDIRIGLTWETETRSAN